jgi:acyl-CoA ligase (AMP-forming) (exosortase A-associated)
MHVQLHDLVKNSALNTPGAPALSFKDTTLNYGELWRRVQVFANALVGLELETADRVAIYMDKRIETVTTMFGTSAARGSFVPVNPLLKPKQVSYNLNDCDVKVLITTRDRYALLEEELNSCKALKHIILFGDGETPEMENFEMTAEGDAAGKPEPLSVGVDTDMAAIFYTSGSTGKPKGVVLSHRNMIVGAESVSSYIENTPEDVIASVLPLSFDAGFSQLTTAFASGAHVVLINYLLPSDVVKACAKYGVTGITAVPPLWLQLVDASWPIEVTSKIRYFANTGGRMPKSTLDKLRGLFPLAKPFLMYGLTEAFRSTYLHPDEVDNRPDSIGKAIPNAEILVVRPDGSICADGEPGELVHRGPLVAMGYWNNPEKTDERFKNSPGQPSGVMTQELAVYSGDIVTRDAEGFLYFVGRNDEMIKTSGYRTSPTEVEEMVLDTGLVTEVVAFGVADERLGQRIVITVSPEIDTEELLSELRKTMPRYMVPSTVVCIPELPRSANGKFDRNLINEEYSK